jgi:arsenate reductase
MTVLFVCVHNAARSQMAEAFLNDMARERGLTVRGISAGTMAAGELDPRALEAMAEIGLPMEGQSPKVLTPAMVEQADRIVSMGCGVDADACPTRFLVTEDWGLDDPSGKPMEQVRAIRDRIRSKVEGLLDELTELA